MAQHVLPNASSSCGRGARVEHRPWPYRTDPQAYTDAGRWAATVARPLSSVLLTDVILANPLHIGGIAVSLIIQTFAMFAIAYGWARVGEVASYIGLPERVAGVRPTPTATPTVWSASLQAR